MLKFFEGVSTYIDKFLQMILAVFGVALVLINLAQIIGRYVFFYSLPWSEEISVYLYAWMIFLALHAITRDRADLTIEVFRFQNKRIENIVGILRDIVVLVTIVILLRASWDMIGFATRFPRRTAALGINTTGLYYAMPISFVLVIFQKILGIFQRIRDLRSPNTLPEEN